MFLRRELCPKNVTLFLYQSGVCLTSGDSGNLFFEFDNPSRQSLCTMVVNQNGGTCPHTRVRITVAGGGGHLSPHNR
jgi:hypothetical protein